MEKVIIKGSPRKVKVDEVIEEEVIEEKVIERRYTSGISNLFKLYVSKVDSLLIYDNSNIESELIAEKRTKWGVCHSSTHKI